MRAGIRFGMRASALTAVLLVLAASPAGARRGQMRAAETAALPVTLTVELSEVRLFSDAVVSGHLDPPHPGMFVQVALLLAERTLERRAVPLSADGASFATTFPIEDWGRFRAQATFEGDADHDPSTVESQPRDVRPPRPLHQGSRSDWVKILEERLSELRYHLPRPNRHFDTPTGDAVLAFHKVHGMGRSKAVSRRTWKRLTDPRTPKPRAKKPKTHVEIDQTKQVLYVVRDGEIDEIIHTSTGAGGATRDGVFRVHRKIAGFSPGHLYYPSYFDGNRAVHGWPDVPPTNASHGCSRVPYWTAKHLFAIMHYGMEVRVYH